jgi:hypothetical protein
VHIQVFPLQARHDQVAHRAPLFQPFTGEVQTIGRLAVQQSGAGAAMGVAAHDDLADIQDVKRIFDGRSRCGAFAAMGRNHVADIAQLEHVAGFCRGQRRRQDAGIRTGDEQALRLLTLACQRLISMPVPSEVTALEA